MPYVIDELLLDGDVADSLMDIRLILLDIDGTLIRGNAFDLENVRKQLNRLGRPALGIRFTVATGRTVFGARQVLRSLDPDGRLRSIIAYNGGVIAHPEATPWIERETIDPSAYQELVYACKRLGFWPLIYTCRHTFEFGRAEDVFGESNLFTSAMTEFNGMAVTQVSSLLDVPAENVVAVLASLGPGGEANVNKLVEQLSDSARAQLRITTSGGAYAEIASSKSTKALAMHKLCTRLGLRAKEVMAVGDNFNDLEMLMSSGVGVAVANSPPEVKDACRLITKYDATAGVVQALRYLASVRRASKRRHTIGLGD